MMTERTAAVLAYFFLCIGFIACQPESGQSRDEIVYDIKASEFKCRDPFIFYHKGNDLYYLHVNGSGKLKCYTSKDLEWWRYECDSFVPDSDFWGKKDFWAPDMFEYRGKYYILATFSADGRKRGSSFLVSDRPEGPYEALVNGPVTPPDKMCLDATLYIDGDGRPWLIYCHEWLEAVDGEIYAAPLSDDLKSLDGEPTLLFKASQAPWVGNITSSGVTGKVTDAPFIFRQDDVLLMIWSSYRADNGRYAIGQAYSEGDVTGPWKQVSTPLVSGGGHGMLFYNRAGRLMLSYHAPNSSPSFLTIKKAYYYEGKLMTD